ncbi:Very short patch repair protein [subsurface metagenome]
MAKIRSKDTGPEMAVRRLVHSMGYRYRLHCKDLPGKPDLVFRSLKKVIFVNGCFWHRHHCKAGQAKPKNRAEYWTQKFDRNKKRDRQTIRRLRADGWEVLVVWECHIRNIRKLKCRLECFLEAPKL